MTGRQFLLWCVLLIVYGGVALGLGMPIILLVPITGQVAGALIGVLCGTIGIIAAFAHILYLIKRKERNGTLT